MSHLPTLIIHQSYCPVPLLVSIRSVLSSDNGNFLSGTVAQFVLVLNPFLSIALYRGNLGSFGFHLFSVTSSDLHHSAIVPLPVLTNLR